MGISHTYLPIMAAISLFMVACDQAPLMLPKMEDQNLLMLPGHLFSGCSWAHESARFARAGGHYVEN